MTKWKKFINGTKKIMIWILKILNILMLYIPRGIKYLGIAISLITPKGKEAEAKRQVKINEQKVAKLNVKINNANVKLTKTNSKLEVKKDKVILIQETKKIKKVK